jgi:hypothetical protein
MNNKQSSVCPDCGANTQETHVENGYTSYSSPNFGYTKITACTKCEWFQMSIENIGQQVEKRDISQDYPVVEMLTNMVQEQQLKLEKQNKELELLKARVTTLETIQNSTKSTEYNNGLKQLAMREANRIKSERE